MKVLFVPLALLAIITQCIIATASSNVNFLYSAFMKNLVDMSIRFFNANSAFYVIQPKDFVYFDILQFKSELSEGVNYNLTMRLAEVICSKPELIPLQPTPNIASCHDLTNRFFDVSFSIVYRPWLIAEKFHLSVRKVQAVSDSAISLPSYPEFLGFELPDDAEAQFRTFKTRYGKLYSVEDENAIYRTFKRNLIKIQFLNRIDTGPVLYGVTEFTDLTVDEFRKTHANMRKPTQKSIPITFELRNKTPPASFDWRTKGAVTNVKNQGMCGSCWAFAATGNIEGQWFMKTGKLIPLSEQQLLDCDSKDEACNGGYPEWAYESIVKMGGLMSEDAYPYEATKEESCQLKPRNISAYINDSASLPNDEKLLAAWLAENGPVSVGVNAMFLQFYLFGISHPPHILCSKDGLDHAVLLVGYGTSRFLRRPYWIVKNSWSSWWGERGYFRMYRGDGTCGINADPTTAIIR